jgi:rare lipoprotein A
MAGTRVDFATRLSPARASRGAERPMLLPASTTSSTVPPPPTTAKPKPKVVYKAPSTTAKPKPKQQAASTAPKPAASSSNTPTTVSPRPMPTGGSTSNGSEEGRASWYDAKYHANNPWICAHKTLPMGTILTVLNVNTGKSIKCEVGDRGPYVEGRVVDLSKYAFSQLGNPSSGLIWVKLSW